MQIENEHDKAIAYHDTIAPKMEEKSSKKSYSSSDITIERSIYFFYWLFKFARSVVVKSRSAFLFPDLHKQKTDRHERLFTSVCLLFYFFTFLPFYPFTFKRLIVCVFPVIPVTTAIPLSRISTFSYLASTITFPFNVITPQCLGICSKAQ